MPEEEAAATIEVSSQAELGESLIDREGMNLYLFEPDAQGESTCYGDCAEAWPPLTTAGDPIAGEDAVDVGLLGTVERDDGSLQVTYNEWPLYYFARDAEPGDTAGHGVGDVWFLVTPEGQLLDAEE